MSKGKLKEGGVYRCKWKRRAGVYRLKCPGIRTAESKDADLERAKDELRARIMDATGDGEAQLQFEPPLLEESNAEGRLFPAYFALGYNDTVDWRIEDQGELYVDGVCNRCGTGLGARTNITRKVTSIPRYDVVGFRKDRNRRMMCSANVLKHFKPFLNNTGHFIEVEFDDKIKKSLAGRRFYEVDFCPSVEVAVPSDYDGFSKISSFRCVKCGTQHLFFSAKKLRSEYSTYALRSVMQGRVMFLGEGAGRVIAVDAQLRGEIMRNKHIKGLVTAPLIMLNDDEALTAKEIQKVKLPSP